VRKIGKVFALTCLVVVSGLVLAGCASSGSNETNENMVAATVIPQV
jgi:hypothetical protein